jgi:hypothetical protein
MALYVACLQLGATLAHACILLVCFCDCRLPIFGLRASEVPLGPGACPLVVAAVFNLVELCFLSVDPGLCGPLPRQRRQLFLDSWARRSQCEPRASVCCGLTLSSLTSRQARRLPEPLACRSSP